MTMSSQAPRLSARLQARLPANAVQDAPAVVDSRTSTGAHHLDVRGRAASMGPVAGPPVKEQGPHGGGGDTPEQTIRRTKPRPGPRSSNH